VNTFFSVHKDLARLPKIAVIGKKTAEGLAVRGLKAEFFPSAFVAESFVEEFLPIVPGVKVLIPKGNLARDYIAASLSDAGAVVDEVVIYETYMPEESRPKLAKILSESQLDILLFTSPSTVDNFMDVVNEFELNIQIKKCIIGCIGPVTEKKLLSYGLTVHASPKEYTVKEMVKSTIAYIVREEL
jgi:uroporphyrinogen-III synthase